MGIGRCVCAILLFCSFVMEARTFLYFAYGSNLLAKRIHINNPSAVRIGSGRLKNYRLDFAKYSKRWMGCAATIVKKEGAEVWGAIWELDEKHKASLDVQEGVKDNFYFAYEVDVEPPEGGLKRCRVYEQCTKPNITENIEDIEHDRRPSAVYLNVILEGAKESNLPEHYQKFLKKIPHNGYDGEVDILRLNEK